MNVISIVMPIFNEAAILKTSLESMQPLRHKNCELLVVDGGSHDASAEIAAPLVDRLITSRTGRAVQMNAGARVAQGDILWFLHSDCSPPCNADHLVRSALTDVNHVWGRFDVSLSGHHPLLRCVETLMNGRSRLTGIATGDQGIFVRRHVFEQLGGYPNIALMEDIALSRALKRVSRPVCLRQRLHSSSRRWEKRGVVKTILLMWRLRLAYFLGADPARLARIYYGA
jgi:rSAM/selenodomain-associated transferase 2